MNASGHRMPRPRALMAHAAGCAVAAAVVALYGIHGAMPHNALELPFERQIQIALVLPEGWAFFTKSPRDSRFLVFEPKQDGSWARKYGDSTDLATTFGFNRETRALDVEAGLIASHVPESAWRKCPTTPATCLAVSSGTSVIAINDTPHPSLCGPLGLVQQDRLPWAWAKVMTQEKMPSTIARIDVRCTNP